jgi:hypothetical protein
MWAERAFSFDHISRSDWWLLASMLSGGYLYIFKYLGSLPRDHWLIKLQDSCIAQCHDAKCQRVMQQSRDEHYYDGKDHSPCAFTTWEVTHYAFHVFLGYKYNLWVSFGISVAFEIWEHMAKDCGSFLDIFYNGLGALTGLGLRLLIDQQKLQEF